MKKIIKISIIVIVSLVLLIGLTGFLILKTDSWKTILVSSVNRQLMQNYNLKIEPEGIGGNIFYHLQFDRLKLTNQNQTELVTMSGVNLSYNLKSLIGHHHILNKLSLDTIKLAYPANIDSLLASFPEKKDTLASTGNFKLANILMSKCLIDDSHHPGQLLVSIDSLNGSLSLNADTINLQLNSTDFYVTEINEYFRIKQTAIAFVNNSLEIKNGQISNRGTTAELDGRISLHKPYASQLRINVTDINPAERLPALSQVFRQDDIFDLSGEIKTSDKTIKLDLGFSGTWHNQLLTNGRITGLIDGKQVNLAEMTFTKGMEQVHGTVVGNLDSSLTAELRFSGIDASSWGLSAINTDLQGNLHVQTFGSIPNIDQIKVKIDLQESKIAPLDFNLIRGELVYKDGLLTVLDSLYCVLGETKLIVEGEADLNGNSIDARAHFSDLNAEMLAPMLKMDTLSGVLDGFVEATGILTAPDLRGWIHAKQFGLPNLKFEETMARFGIVDVRTRKFGDIFVEATNCQTNLIPEKIPLTSLIIHINGDTTIVQTLKAIGENLDVEAKGYIVQFTDFNLNSITILRSGNVLQNIDPLSFSLKQDTINVDAVRLRLNEGILTLTGQVVRGELQSGRLEFANLSIDPINTYLKGSQGVGGKLEGMVAYKKNLDRVNYVYKINLDDAKLISQNFENIQLQGQLDNHRILIENLAVKDNQNGLLTGHGFLTCNLNFKNKKPFLSAQDSIGLTLNFNRFNLGSIDDYLPSNLNIGGIVDGQINIFHYLSNPKMNCDLIIDDPVFDKLAGEKLTIKGVYQNERLSITEAMLVDQYGYTRGRGYLALAISIVPARFEVLKEAPLSFNFTTNSSSPSFLTAYLDFLQEVQGDISLALGISGTLENPILSGNISVKGTTIYLDLLENPITGINGSAVIKDNILEIVSLTGHMKKTPSSGGVGGFGSRLKSVTWDVLFPPKSDIDQPNVAINGTIDFTRFSAPKYNINLKGDELYIRTLLAEQEGLVSGNIILTGQDTVIYAGEIEVEDFVIRNEFTGTKKAVVPKQPSKIYSIMNFHLIIPGSLEIKNSQLEGELEGDIWITRNGNEPFRFSGTLDILDGQFFAYGWEFEIVRGSINLDPVEFNPTLDIEAQVDLASYGMSDTTTSSSIESEVVTVYLTGYLDNPNIEFQSTNYSQSDILLFLSRAQSIGSITNGQDQLSASAANVASMWFERQLERNISRISGLDDFELRTNGNLFSSQQPDQWSVMLGRKIAPNLYIKYERSFSLIEPYQQFGLEYRINRNISIAGTYDQDGYSINYRYKYRY
ncbi:MAG TPA: translocation/assembly module TamB domain-containing protein [Candidatus Marinimicrobia bacterium]|nr:translocation/assembly module TamB domain-containing protein [Candidatus Neomarinimicrobiota bacterium]